MNNSGSNSNDIEKVWQSYFYIIDRNFYWTHIKEDMNYNKLKSYGVFALVLLFLVWQTVDFFRVNFWLLSGRFLGRFDTISSVLWLELRYLLKIFYGFLLLPLCLPTVKKKVVPADIALIVFGLVVVIFGPKLTAFLNGANRLTWAGWVALLTVVPIVNISGKSPRISFKDYCKNIFKLPLSRKDKRTDMEK